MCYSEILEYKNRKKQPLVSINVITYGHEKYIRQALNSILMQEVNFEYEIIVGEDFSPDSTRKILKEYEKKYPGKFVMIYRDVNIGPRRNAYDVSLKCRGKYIAVLEGDDYWIDKGKLQKQIDFLESNPKYVATAHNVLVVDENCNIKKEKYPTCKSSVYTINHFRKGYLPGQFGTIVMRNIYKNSSIDLSIMNDHEMSPGDRLNAMILSALGPVYRFEESMSAYRHVTSAGTSYSANKKKKSPLQMYKYWSKLLKFSRSELRNVEMNKYIEKREMFWILRCIGTLPSSEITQYIFNNKKNTHAIVYSVLRLLFLPIEKVVSKIKRFLKGDF